MRLTPPLNLPAPGRRQCLYVVLRDFADTCVFAKQSLEPILCDPFPLRGAKPRQVLEVPLLPKLRGHFAEFLLHKSLEHLRLLASPTCVRFRYGQPMDSPNRLFSAAGSNPLRLFRGRDFALRSQDCSLPRWTGTTIARPDLRSCVPCGINIHRLVQEC